MRHVEGRGKTVSVVYDDQTKEEHCEDDSSWDENDFMVLPDAPSPPKQRRIDQGIFSPSPAQLRSMLKRHMEARIIDKLYYLILLKRPVRTNSFHSVLVDFSAADHLFFFGTMDPIHLNNDDEMRAILTPVSSELPSKRIGRARGNQRIFVCAKGLVARTAKNTKTRIVFAYSRFDQQEDKSWLNCWTPVAGTPWKE